MLRSCSRSLCVALAAGLLLAGCSDNLFSGFQDEGTSDDPKVLLADAQAALAQGDTTRALDYLERAHDLDPDDGEVRVMLVSTKFEMNDVDLLTIREIGEYIAGGGTTAFAKTDPNYICSFDGNPSNYEPFDFAAAPAFQRLTGLRTLFDEAETLLSDLGTNQTALSENIRARMLLIRAFTRAFQTVSAVDREVKQLSIQPFRLPGNDIGVCFDANQLNSISDAQQRVEDIQEIVVCTLLPGYDQAMADLRARNELLNGSTDNIIIDVMGDALDAMRNSLDATCTAS